LDYKRGVPVARPHEGQDKGRNGRSIPRRLRPKSDKYCDKPRVKGRRISFYSTEEVDLIIHDNLNAITSQGSENAIIYQITFSVSPTSSLKNILFTHTQPGFANCKKYNNF
jgi:hypothetical protein